MSAISHSMSTHVPERDPWRGRIEAAALLLAGALIGLGLVMWIAANWADFGKFGRFGLVGAVLAASALAAAALPRLRVGASLIGVLAIGGMLALFGQTYQSGADPWQLFALWAALALPWATAARHDAVWSLWVIVAFAGLSLWLYAQVGRMRAPPLELLLPPWVLGGIIAFVLSPWAGLSTWIGRTDWTHRLASVLWLVFVAGTALPVIIDGRTAFATGPLAIFLAAGLLWLHAQQSPRDALVMAAATLAIDVMLITAVFRSASLTRGNGFELLTLGLVAAGIVAASAILLLKLLRGEGLKSWTQAVPAAPTAAPLAASDIPPWPVAVVSGVGAVFAALPLIVFIGLTFGMFLDKGPGAYVVGGVMTAAAVVLLQRAKAISFGQQFAFIGLTTGLILVSFGFYRDMPSGMASLILTAIAFSIAVLVPVGWIRGLLGMAGASFVTIAMAVFISSIMRGSLPANRFSWLMDANAFRLAWMMSSLAAGAAMFALSRPHGEPIPIGEKMKPFVAGAAVSCLLGLMAAAGPTFLLGATWSPGVARLGTGADVGHLSTLARAASLLCALGAVALLWQSRPDLGSPAGMAIGVAAAILSAFAPVLGPAVLLLSVAWLAGRPAVAILALFAVLWIIGAFYYWLGWPLQQKAILLAALGLGLGGVAWVSGTRLPVSASHSALAPAASGLLAAGLIAISALATGGVTAKGIVEKEAIITSGKRVFVALVPVDPRSLMQGDYMALRFTLPDMNKAPKPTSGEKLFALAVVDDRGVAAMSSLSSTLPTIGTTQVTFALAVKNGRWILGTDAWFFKEGTAKDWAKAKFGEFRVIPTGEAILVGMADAELKAIK